MVVRCRVAWLGLAENNSQSRDTEIKDVTFPDCRGFHQFHDMTQQLMIIELLTYLQVVKSMQPIEVLNGISTKVTTNKSYRFECKRGRNVNERNTTLVYQSPKSVVLKSRGPAHPTIPFSDGSWLEAVVDTPGSQASSSGRIKLGLTYFFSLIPRSWPPTPMGRASRSRLAGGENVDEGGDGEMSPKPGRLRSMLFRAINFINGS